MGSVSDVRALVTGVISALPGWTVSRWSPDLFGRDTDHVMHKAFVVSAPESSINARDGRQRVAEGLLVDTTAEVSWAYRIRGDAQAADYDAALDAEQALVSAVKAISDAHVLFERATRRAGPEGFVLGTVRFRIVHRYALTV